MAQSTKPRVFVITPFGEDFIALFNYLKDMFKEEFDFTNAGDMDNQQNVLQDIVGGIAHADIIIADLTNLNPNVFYELGLAHAMNKKVIIITQAIDELPFDIKSYRANQYSLQFNKLSAFTQELEKLLHGAVDGSVKYGNPVSDYAPTYRGTNIPASSLQVPPVVNEGIEHDEKDDEGEDGDKGFLDFIADIEEDMDKQTAELNSLAEKTREIGVSFTATTDDINRVKAQSGKVDAAFARNLCRKLAEPMEAYAGKVKSSVSVISTCWSNVENNYLALLDSEFVRTPENIEGLKESVESLTGLQTSIRDSDNKIESFIHSLRGNTGMERRLTRALSSAATELEAYQNLTDTISSSIDRIVRKSEIVLSSAED